MTCYVVTSRGKLTCKLPFRGVFNCVAENSDRDVRGCHL